MSPELQNLLLKDTHTQQREWNALPDAERERLAEELGQHYRPVLPDFGNPGWILRVPKNRFEQMCPPLQVAALRYATEEERNLARRQSTCSLAGSVLLLFLLGSCTATCVGVYGADGRDSGFYHFIASIGTLVYGITIIVLLFVLFVGLLNRISRIR